MILRKRFAAALLLIACTLAPLTGSCADETALFNSIPPDVLIMIDLSGSMKRNPAAHFVRFTATTTAPSSTGWA